MNVDLFTIHEYRIDAHHWNSDPVYLIPFGDIHRHTTNCDLDRWHDFLSWAKTKERSYFLGMGDYDDMLSESERPVITDPRFHKQTIDSLEAYWMKQTDELCDELSFMKNRLVGFLEGNHYTVFSSGITSTQYMCHALSAKYLGYSSFIRLFINVGHTTLTTDIWAHHGTGAARTIGGSINSVERMEAISYCQIALMGHDHRKSVSDKIRFRLDSSRPGKLRLVPVKIILARTGSFLRSYKPGQGSYASRAVLPPTDLGTVKIELTPRRTEYKENGRPRERVWLDLHASI